MRAQDWRAETAGYCISKGDGGRDGEDEKAGASSRIGADLMPFIEVSAWLSIRANPRAHCGLVGVAAHQRSFACVLLHRLFALQTIILRHYEVSSDTQSPLMRDSLVESFRSNHLFV